MWNVDINRNWKTIWHLTFSRLGKFLLILLHYILLLMNKYISFQETHVKQYFSLFQLFYLFKCNLWWNINYDTDILSLSDAKTGENISNAILNKNTHVFQAKFWLYIQIKYLLNLSFEGRFWININNGFHRSKNRHLSSTEKNLKPLLRFSAYNQILSHKIAIKYVFFLSIHLIWINI